MEVDHGFVHDLRNLQIYAADTRADINHRFGWRNGDDNHVDLPQDF